MKKWATGLVSAMSCITLSAIAPATNERAQTMVATFTKEKATMLAKYPSLVLIENVIRFDCADKILGKTSTDAFCCCASSVTLGLWRSGADPQVPSLLNNFLKNPSKDAASVFLNYQGPELYRAICTAAFER